MRKCLWMGPDLWQREEKVFAVIDLSQPLLERLERRVELAQRAAVPGSGGGELDGGEHVSVDFDDDSVTIYNGTEAGARPWLGDWDMIPPGVDLTHKVARKCDSQVLEVLLSHAVPQLCWRVVLSSHECFRTRLYELSELRESLESCDPMTLLEDRARALGEEPAP